jgi:cell division protein FtsW
MALSPTSRANYQTLQAVIAFLLEGWFGVGIRQGSQKLTAPAFAHTDSVFAVIREELGVLGAALVVGPTSPWSS